MNGLKEKNCIYCESGNEGTHFCCDVCGIGMCDDCYDINIEHDSHYNRVLEVCEDKETRKAILKACDGIEPEYICQSCLDEIIQSWENKKFELAKKLAEELVGTRWSKRTLNQYLKKRFKSKSLLEDVDESGLISDYNFLYGINKEWGYMDIYYLKVPYDFTGSGKNLYITEVSVSKE